ncbi:MAG TPA: putative toxin-antitoxin system toxin component, PIN family [Geobacteraceae bacterium]
MKAVFDTNVLIAAFISEGVCAKILTRARKKQFQLVTCPFVLNELERVLKKKFKATTDEVNQALDLITETVHIEVAPVKNAPGICRDPDDDNVLACALAAEADYLVTGDDDLLVLKSHRGIKILAPRDFELLFED